MKKMNKKGFTIVELVIVIAIIAILAAVLIPTFASLIKKANVSKDQQLIRNLNTALAADVDKAHPTMTDALAAAAEFGYDVSKINKSATDNEILWDSKNDLFCYFNGTEIEYIPKSTLKVAKDDLSDVDYFVISDTINGKYSTYLYNTTLTVVTDLKTGLDVGNEAVTSINYDRSSEPVGQEVVIRTNGGTLTINAENDTVKHYGEGLLLDIQAIAGSSFHEYGYFQKALIAQGRIVVEEEGNIPAVEITAVPTAEKPVKIETNKDVVVSASQAVVTELGDNNLDNVEVKVTSTEAAVVVDEKIDSSDVTINGQTATPEELVSITKVSTYSEFSTALSAKKPYIMFTSNISYETNGSGLLNVDYNVTIDGNGCSLDGYGERGSQKTTLCINNDGGTQVVDVKLQNLTVNNSGAKGRPIETRGNIQSLSLDNVVVNATGSGNNQGITIGGTQTDMTLLNINNTNINATKSGYPIITFNPIDATIEDSVLEGYCAVYFKTNTGSGAHGSHVDVNNCTLNSPNSFTLEGANSFGIFATDSYIDGLVITVNNTNVNNAQNNTAKQALLLPTYCSNITLTINGDSFVNGDLSLNGYWSENCKIIINGGKFTKNPLTANGGDSYAEYGEEFVASFNLVEIGQGKTLQETSDFMWIVK